MRSYVAQIIASKVVGPSAPPGPAPEPVQYNAAMLARASTSQSFSSNVPRIIAFDTELFDTANVFSSTIFTVPVEMDGMYGLVQSNVQITNGRTGTGTLQVSTDSGSTWIDISVIASQGRSHYNVVNGPRLLNSGDQYRMEVVTNPGSTAVVQSISSNFSVLVLG